MYVCQSALNMYRVFIWEGIMYLLSEPIHYIHIDAATYLNRLSAAKQTQHHKQNALVEVAIYFVLVLNEKFSTQEISALDPAL